MLSQHFLDHTVFEELPFLLFFCIEIVGLIFHFQVQRISKFVTVRHLIYFTADRYCVVFWFFLQIYSISVHFTEALRYHCLATAAIPLISAAGHEMGLSLISESTRLLIDLDSLSDDRGLGTLSQDSSGPQL